MSQREYERSITVITDQANTMAGLIKNSFDSLAPGEPLLIIRRSARQTNRVLAVKAGEGTIMAKDDDPAIYLPVVRYAEGSGSIAVVENHLRIGVEDLIGFGAGQEFVAAFGTEEIREWVFGRIDEYSEDEIEMNKDKIMGLIRLAAKIGFTFTHFRELILVADAEIAEPIKRLANIMNIGLDTPETIARAKSILADLAALGLVGNDKVADHLLRVREAETKEFLERVASSR